MSTNQSPIERLDVRDIKWKIHRIRNGKVKQKLDGWELMMYIIGLRKGK